MPDVTSPICVMTDTSLIVTGAIVMQKDFHGDLHLCVSVPNIEFCGIEL
jgi:hypothetical protein